jgi:hypothetical protein
MAHFNPQACVLDCCLQCAGTLEFDGCFLRWDSSGEVVSTRLIKRGETEDEIVLVDVTEGEMREPPEGVYVFEVICSRLGDLNAPLFTYRTEEVVVEDVDCPPLTIGPCCLSLIESGYTGMTVSWTASPFPYSAGNGSRTILFEDLLSTPFVSLCGVFGRRPDPFVATDVASGVITRTPPNSDVNWRISHNGTYYNFNACIVDGFPYGLPGNVLRVYVDVTSFVKAVTPGSGNIFNPGGGACQPEQEVVTTNYLGEWGAVSGAGGVFINLTQGTITRARYDNESDSPCVLWFCPDYLNTVCGPPPGPATISWRLF